MNPKNLLEELKASPKRSLGQNFLVNPAVIEKIIQATRDLKPKCISEVGPGTGALTENLKSLGHPMILVELDAKFAEHWREKGFDVIEKDALALNWEGMHNGSEYVLVSNLPYQISSSLLIDRSIERGNLTGMVLMFQKEVAQRIQAKKKTADYGLLSVIAQVFWDVSRVCDADPKSFYPPPRVASRVLKFIRKDEFTGNAAAFLKFVKTAFAQRRKLLVKNLSSYDMGESLKSLGFSDKVRAEELSPQEFVKLWESKS